MRESEEVSLLVAGIYDAALDPGHWSDVLERTHRFVGGCAASVFAQDSVRPHATLFYEHGNDPHFIQLYREKFIHMNPMVPASTYFEVGRVFSLVDMIPDGEFRETRFCKEFAEPQGIFDGLFCNLEKSGTSYSVISVPRSVAQGRVDDESRRRLELLVPHFRRSVIISNVIERHQAEKMALADTLGQVDAAVFLVDGTGSVSFANEQAEALLSEGRILRRSQHVFAAVDPKANRSLQESLAAAKAGDAMLGVRGVAIALTHSQDDRWLAHILPLTSGNRQSTGITYTAVAAVFVRKVFLDTVTPLESMAKIHKLTAMEVRVLQAISEIGGTPAVSEQLGISETTVKTHLKNLFSKTGARRQADLVKLIAAHASPFRDPARP